MAKLTVILLRLYQDKFIKMGYHAQRQEAIAASVSRQAVCNTVRNHPSPPRTSPAELRQAAYRCLRDLPQSPVCLLPDTTAPLPHLDRIHLRPFSAPHKSPIRSSSLTLAFILIVPSLPILYSFSPSPSPWHLLLFFAHSFGLILQSTLLPLPHPRPR